jgi:hypothetical protein
MPEQPPKFLLSYHYFKRTDLDRLVERMPIKPMIFADSGAYSAFTQGAEIDIKDYAAWIKRWEHLFTTYVNLDVIRDPKATSQNQAILERLGLQPIPVFHTGTDFKHLDRLMKRYPYIALGGMVKAERKATLRWAATCHKRAQDYGSVFHGFGQTSMENVMSIPWYSVDSSSWAGGFMYGRIEVWDGRRWQQCQVGNRASVMKVAPIIRDHGFDPNVFADRAIYHRSHAVKLAAVTWHRFEAFLRQRHGAISIPKRDDGLHLYHAQADKAQMNEFTDGMHIYFADTSIGVNQRDAAEGLHLYLAAGNGSNNNEVDVARAVSGDLSRGNDGTHVYHASSSTTEIVDGTQGLHLYLAQATKEDMERESDALAKERKNK